jgi:hypothetical protein
MDREPRYRRGTDVVTRTIAGETLLVPVRRGLADMDRLFTLNETGTEIWARLDGRTTINELADALVARHDVDLAQARIDARELLVALHGAALVEECEP